MTTKNKKKTADKTQTDIVLELMSSRPLFTGRVILPIFVKTASYQSYQQFFSAKNLTEHFA